MVGGIFYKKGKIKTNHVVSVEDSVPFSHQLFDAIVDLCYGVILDRRAEESHGSRNIDHDLAHGRVVLGVVGGSEIEKVFGHRVDFAGG